MLQEKSSNGAKDSGKKQRSCGLIRINRSWQPGFAYSFDF